MIGLGEIWSALSFARDGAYEAVFHIGDTSLQFTADLIHGPDNPRHERYAYREIGRREKQAERRYEAAQGIKQPSKPPARVKPERPLNFEEKRVFSEMTRRRAGESIIEHWKRRKQLLEHPHKRQLIEIERKLEAEAQKDHSIHVERKSIAQDYQQQRVRAKPRSRNRSR